MLELSNFWHCVQHPWKPTSWDFWSSRNESKPLYKEKCVLRKYCGVTQKWWGLELSNLWQCVQHPWKLTSRDFWSSRHDRKPELQKSILVSFQGCWTQCQRFESSSMHHFWDTPLHFLKTCFSLENGFLLFLELQKSLLVSFRDAEHNVKGLKVLALTISDIHHNIFSKHIFPYKVAYFHS